MKYRDKTLEEIRHNIIFSQSIDLSLRKMSAFVRLNALSMFERRIEEVKSNYQRMKTYMRQGLKDPKADEVYCSLLCNCYQLNSDIQLQLLIRNNGSYVRAHQDAAVLDMDRESIKQKLEMFVQDIAMLSLETGEAKAAKQKDIYRRHQEYIDQLFNSLVVSSQWNEGTMSFWNELLTSPLIDINDACLLVSAIMLSCVQLYDFYKFSALLYVYRHAENVNLRQRALVGVVFSISDDERRLYPEMGKELRKLGDDENIRKELLELQIQVFYCLKADSDLDTIQKDIMPNLVEGNGLMITRTGLVEKEEDPTEEILHPGASDKAMEALEKSLQRMMDMQKAGSDIYFGGFAKMKRFSFFYTLSNWFVPFYLEHPELNEVNDKLKGSKFMDILLEKGPFCDSDKYSFAIAMRRVIDQIPANMREMLNSVEAIGVPIAEDAMTNPAYIRRMYLQNLYRFYRLYHVRNDFVNPFDLDSNSAAAFFFADHVFRDTQLISKSLELGRFFLKHGFYDELLGLLDNFKQKDNIDYYYLSATAYRKKKRNIEASIDYGKMLSLDPDNERALKGRAQTAFSLDHYGDAVECYGKLVKLFPENNGYLLNLSISMINNDQVEEAMRHLYKLNYEHPGNLHVRRALAWGYMNERKNDQAERVYDQLIAENNHVTADYLNAGYCKWFQAKIEQAVKLFKTYEQKRANDPHYSTAFLPLKEIFKMDRKLLELNEIRPVDSAIMADIVRE